MIPCPADLVFFDRSIDHVSEVARRIVRFKMNLHRLRIKRRSFDRNRVRTGIDRTRKRFAVPLQFDRNRIAIGRTRTPIAFPCSGQWIGALLGDGRVNTRQQKDQEQTREADFQSHCRSPSISRSRSISFPLSWPGNVPVYFFMIFPRWSIKYVTGKPTSTYCSVILSFPTSTRYLMPSLATCGLMSFAQPD